MNCPDEIADILLEIIRVATLNIRGAGNQGDAEQCAVEADHIHNLPSLLMRYRPELLRFYWNIERTGYIRYGKGYAESVQTLWDRLEMFVDQER